MGFPTAVTATDAKVGPEKKMFNRDDVDQKRVTQKFDHFSRKWKIGVDFFVFLVEFPQWNLDDLDLVVVWADDFL